jgi:hypothetical protein
MFTLSSTRRTLRGTGGPGSVNVAAPAGCAWTAVSNAGWITIASGQSGNGNATVTYAVSANRARTGTMSIAGQTFTVKQRQR